MENNNLHIWYENIQSLSMNFDSILQEIAEFNKSYGLIQKTSKSVKQSVNTLIDEHEYWDEFDEEREFRVERILHLSDELWEYWLKISTYKWEEFYESNTLKYEGYKIWLEIYDQDLFIEFVQQLNPQTNMRIFTFLFNVIIDSLKMSDFYGKNHANEEKNKHISDVLDIVHKCWEIHSPQMNFLIEDYTKSSLYQSLLSKFFIKQIAVNTFVISVRNSNDYDQIDNTIIDSMSAIETIVETVTRENHYLQHLHALAYTLLRQIDYLYSIIIEEAISDENKNAKNSQYKKYKNIAHESFVRNFINEYPKRRIRLVEVLSEK